MEKIKVVQYGYGKRAVGLSAASSIKAPKSSEPSMLIPRLWEKTLEKVWLRL